VQFYINLKAQVNSLAASPLPAPVFQGRFMDDDENIRSLTPELFQIADNRFIEVFLGLQAPPFKTVNR
jgi:hypothetical protein